MASTDLNFTGIDQRKIAMRLAEENNAPQTLSVIKDPNSTYASILASAASEIGLDRLTQILLENDPIWAHNALLDVPDLGLDRAVLIRKAGELVERSNQRTENVAAAALEGGLPLVSAIELYLAPGAAFEAKFTMFWFSAPNVIQPWTGTPDPSKWQWSIKLSIAINRSWEMKCSEFALPGSPLAPGDTAWMNVDIVCGSQYQLNRPPFLFTYQPDAPSMRINTWGVVTGPQFGIAN